MGHLLRSFPVMAATLVAACATTPAPEQTTDAAQAVEMRFGWQPGDEARVAITRERAVNDQPVAAISFAYTMSVSDRGDHLLVESSDYDLGDAEAFADASDAQLDHLAAMAGSLQPGIVVTRQGDFVDVADLAGFRQRIRRVVAERYPANAHPRLQPLMDMLTSEAFVRDAAGTEWRYIVETVAGAQFDTGRVYRFSERQPASFLPGAPETLIETEMMLRRTFRCERAGRPRTCAEFEMRWRADPEDVERLIARFDEQAQAGLDVPDFEHLAMENSLVLITEPDGLYPHSYEVSKYLAARYRDRSGAQRDDRRRERTRAEFRY